MGHLFYCSLLCSSIGRVNLAYRLELVGLSVERVHKVRAWYQELLARASMFHGDIVHQEGVSCLQVSTLVFELLDREVAVRFLNKIDDIRCHGTALPSAEDNHLAIG